MDNIPKPLRQVLDAFEELAHNPPLYLAAVEALHGAVVELAEECRPSFRDEQSRDTRYEPDWDALAKYGDI